MTTTPFDPSVAQLLPQTHEQELRLQAVFADLSTLDLDVVDYGIDWDETRSPRVQASFDVVPPLDQATLDKLDPRTLVRLRVYVSYRLPSGVVDEQQVAYLHLRVRRLRRSASSSADVLTLDAASAEALFIDALNPNPTAGDAVFTAENLKAAVARYVLDGFAGTPLAGTAVNGPTSTTGSVNVPLVPHPWDALADLADQYDHNIYDPGDGTFYVAPRVTEVGQARLSLSVGANGTILSSDSGVTRDDWANWVVIAYQWTSGGVENIVSGGAQVTAGPYAPATAGYKFLIPPYRQQPGTLGGAALAARTVLRRMLARSRSYTIEAIPAWWLRPEDTVTLQLPLGAQERHLVSRVAFAPGRMMIETRLPDTASTIGE